MVRESEYVNAGNPHLGDEGSGGGGDGSSTAPVMASVTMSLYVYSPRHRLVVFDIDGTITRADVRGYLESVYMDRYDFVHDGVAEFMTRLSREHKNVRFIYVTSRPLEHLTHTRKLLSQNQGPPGPVFMNPESLAAALVQEAVLKRSASMKTRYLADIRTVFTASSRTSSSMDTPFVLGFGNRDSDDQAYRKGALLSGQGVYIVDTNSVLRGEGGAVYADGYRCTRLLAQIASVIGN
jgi:phosphatidate phosphatase PAH1